MWLVVMAADTQPDDMPPPHIILAFELGDITSVQVTAGAISINRIVRYAPP